MSASTSQTATVVNVAATASSGSMLTASGTRKAWVVSNASGQIAYLRFGSAAASATDFTVQIANGGYYESPQPIYNGPVQVILAGAPTGTVNVTSW